MTTQLSGALEKSDIKLFISASAAALAMAVGMGFGRFAYTGIYPIMVHEGVITVHEGTLAASANYAGYLIGALLSARLAAHLASKWVTASIVASILCLFALGITDSPWAIIIIRGLAGVFSAISMISASLWLLQHKGHQSGAPMLFAGVGIGILLSAELLALVETFNASSAQLWAALGVGSLILGAIAIYTLDSRSVHLKHAHGADNASHHIPLGAWSLITSYGLAGFGYIITATYLPMLVKDSLGDINPIHVWSVFGLGAAPSCYLWHKAHQLYGTRITLRTNLLLQAVGVVLPVVAPNIIGYLASALIVGATFMGTVTIVMPAAKRISHTIKFNLFAILTASYGIGQIIGPLLAGYLYAQHQSFASSLVSAAIGLVLATACTFGAPFSKTNIT